MTLPIFSFLSRRLANQLDESVTVLKNFADSVSHASSVPSATPTAEQIFALLSTTSGRYLEESPQSPSDPFGKEYFARIVHGEYRSFCFWEQETIVTILESAEFNGTNWEAAVLDFLRNRKIISLNEKKLEHRCKEEEQKRRKLSALVRKTLKADESWQIDFSMLMRGIDDSHSKLK